MKISKEASVFVLLFKLSRAVDFIISLLLRDDSPRCVALHAFCLDACMLL
jgi:hypothetical protein